MIWCQPFREGASPVEALQECCDISVLYARLREGLADAVGLQIGSFSTDWPPAVHDTKELRQLFANLHA